MIESEPERGEICCSDLEKAGWPAGVNDNVGRRRGWCCMRLAPFFSQPPMFFACSMALPGRVEVDGRSTRIAHPTSSLFLMRPLRYCSSVL